MKYKVLSDQELRAMRGMLEDGIYDYEVMDAVEKTARENPDHQMIELTLKVQDKKGNPVLLKDWLLGYDERFVWKIKAFLDSANRSDKYDGELTTINCFGAKGKLRTRTGKNKRGEEQVFVAGYLPTLITGTNNVSIGSQAKANTTFPDDDIKF